ncbi:MAG: BamA/TamA family outer membrane protein, partial [Spirochaetia bacterium]|nr:BamA/TamA family outer membrane protein [Spirochaetia bacterium]
SFRAAFGLAGEVLATGISDTNTILGNQGRLFQLSPIGVSGGTWVTLRAGAVFEARDVPAYARKGVVEEIWWEESLGGLTDIRESRRLTISHKHYLPILPHLVWAQRLVFDWLSGNWPFFLAERTGGEKELTAFGGGESLRGIVPFRFQGPVKLLSSTELRWHLWFLNMHFLKSDWQWELDAFADLGRVLNAGETFFGDAWHLGYGGGVRLLWGRDFVISLDFAVYRETFGGVYFGVAQAF